MLWLRALLVDCLPDYAPEIWHDLGHSSLDTQDVNILAPVSKLIAKSCKDGFFFLFPLRAT